MRMLICLRPFFGHFYPFVPIACEAEKQGHDVRFATDRSFCPVIAESGFTSVAAGVHPSDPLPAEYEQVPYGRDYGNFSLRRKVEDVLAMAADWQPDVVLRDPTDVAAVLAAEILSIPHATLGFSIYIPGKSWTILLGDRFDELRAEYGLDPDPEWARMHPYLYLDTVPDFFQQLVEPLPVRHPVRVVVAQSRAEPSVPDWMRQLAPGPIAHITLGTAYNRRPRLMRLLIEAASQVARNVIATVGLDAKPDDVWDQADEHVRVEPFIPLSLVLPRSDVVVTAGGYNTVIGAICHGRPMLLLPLGSDQPRNARRAVELGVGLALDADAAEVEDVVGQLRRLLTESSYRINATRLEERNRRLPGPGSAVDLLEALASTGRSQQLAAGPAT
jgi:UDP:flavonoid glycosyltransferase YjiC (YdhE family)